MDKIAKKILSKWENISQWPLSFTLYDVKIQTWIIPGRAYFSLHSLRVSCILHFDSKLFVQLLWNLLDSGINHTYQFWLRIKCHIKSSYLLSNIVPFHIFSISLSKRIHVSCIYFSFTRILSVTKMRLETSNGNQMRGFNEQKCNNGVQIQSFPYDKTQFLSI